MRKLCSVCGTRDVFCTDLCQPHYYRKLRYGDPLGGRKLLPKRGVADDYYDNVVLSFDDPKVCLIWPFGRKAPSGKDAYASMKKRFSRSVCRNVCFDLYGHPPTDKHLAAHSCNNGHLGCVNPKHLRWATPKENSADMVLAGHAQTGSKCPHSKLTLEKVREIRKRRKEGETTKVLSSVYGVSENAIREVHRGATWKEDLILSVEISSRKDHSPE